MIRTRFIIIAAVVVSISIAGWFLRSTLVPIGRWFERTHVQEPISAPAVADASSAAISRGDVSIDPRQQQLMGIRTVTVTRSSLGGTMRAVGAVRYDETRLSDVNVKVEGWIRDLYVDSTGQAIRAGQPLFTLFSPTLLSTESEYLLALKARDQLQASPIADARDQADRLIASARQRLMLWDVPVETIAALDEKRQTEETVTVRAPLAGIVTEKTAVIGLHVMSGQTLYRIADASVVWVEADLYETDLSSVRLGQAANVTFDAYPSEHFAGRVAYVYPYLDEATRTNRVRIALDNPTGRLKPGMFATIELTTASGSGLMVPVDTVLDSGTEQIVFVSLGAGHFTARHVKVGHRSGGAVQILDGLHEGDAIATGAAFFLDSESQLRSGLAGYDAPAPSTGTTPSAAIVIVLRTDPSPPMLGENVFLVSLKDRTGASITDANVSLQLFMPAMPTMNMPAMRNEITLAPLGDGEYRGTGQIMMAGRWDATVVVTRAGQTLGSTHVAVVAR